MDIIAQIERYALPVLSAVVLFCCLCSLFRKRLYTTAEAHLLNSANGDIIPLENAETSIGRSKTCDIVLNYSTVSRSHAVITRKKKGWLIIDTRSSTGTFINGDPAKRRTYLNNGDVISLGGASLVFRNSED